MEIEEHIQRYISENMLFTEGRFDYDNDVSFLQEGILDSVGVMELVGFVESHFGIRVSPNEVTPEHFDSVNKLAAFVRSKQSVLQS